MRKEWIEQEVVLDAGPLAVPGTLTLPSSGPAGAGAVLLSGGGPFDRDATVGPNKPLRDLAWGLASRGVAVLRFDKATHLDITLMTSPGFTMTEEYVPHAVAALDLLQEHARRVFVVGHSMGGKIAPRVAAARPGVAGLVTLAADAQPMHRAAVRVLSHLASLGDDPAVKELAETVARQAAVVDDPGLSAATPAGDLPLGLPGSYWLDVRDYDPVAAASALELPMFILQGGRDYQVTVADDLSLWRAGLGHRPDVTIRVYEADDHLFFPGEGPSTPESYLAAQHVDPVVVEDIAEWLRENI
ncbi:alpha/beta hydrolase family protein [Nonomuraea soli]|uniref:Serine aminopeptidase S33 domain-containing protein n=1 Tax=Nonomuraea soli TaxID=1032476 RepID=A0A7W0CFL9_9ACTN|nr:alpha/beta fold hydrolase [Nonomuraea soli]MBA2890269.1 hypothetical protein [Nonomuraea soli]